MYGKSRVNVKVERGSTFTFTRELTYVVSILFTHVKPLKVNVRTHVKITRLIYPLSRNFYVRTDVNFNWLYVRK